ncbi:type VI secretion system baseplate subunit TssG [Steroidobacter sp. S1-65]|uniref:Type VI secretion system baseplate subunit TssG n=1 Tax=Steroidobacter gossypii TaxID=2805490 RepID=A0ABS1X0J8_9GAMM|nr:type VI secretion system baseplate subunit TssG [Steroidobacter gossypii]MBM0106727.1 type VI secretion system baseplate subunit TssG [Steroidobacter gossypii]
MPPLDLNNQALAQLQAQPHGYTLFAALRLLEQVYADRPRLGEARKAADDSVRLGQAPHLSFAPCDVAQLVNAEDGAVRLEQFAFGLFGPNGALPLHLTELAYERRRHKEDATVVDFLNLFQHRLISLFYRAWAESEPAVSLDRPDSDRFRTYVGALIGMAPESARDADAAPDYAKLSRAGLFASQPRSAEGLEAVLADYFGIEVEVRQFVGSWLEIPDDLRCRLGGSAAAALGSNATLGASTWQCQHKFEIVLGPLPHAAFSNFLPGAPGLRELHSLVRQYTNDEWEWQVRLLLRDVEIPGARLDGASPLGWTSWLGERRAHAADVVIQEQAAGARERASGRHQ